MGLIFVFSRAVIGEPEGASIEDAHAVVFAPGELEVRLSTQCLPYAALQEHDGRLKLGEERRQFMTRRNQSAREIAENLHAPIQQLGISNTTKPKLRGRRSRASTRLVARSIAG